MEKFSRVILLFVIVLCLGCSNTITDAGTKPATLVAPKLVVKVFTDPDNNPEVSLPLMIWDSFEYRKINLKPGWSQGGGKETFCVINEFIAILTVMLKYCIFSFRLHITYSTSSLRLD